jgi:hypothetical protein
MRADISSWRSDGLEQRDHTRRDNSTEPDVRLGRDQCWFERDRSEHVRGAAIHSTDTAFDDDTRRNLNAWGDSNAWSNSNPGDDAHAGDSNAQDDNTWNDDDTADGYDPVADVVRSEHDNESVPAGDHARFDRSTVNARLADASHVVDFA